MVEFPAASLCCLSEKGWAFGFYAGHPWVLMKSRGNVPARSVPWKSKMFSWWIIYSVRCYKKKKPSIFHSDVNLNPRLREVFVSLDPSVIQTYRWWELLLGTWKWYRLRMSQECIKYTPVIHPTVFSGLSNITCWLSADNTLLDMSLHLCTASICNILLLCHSYHKNNFFNIK